MAIGRVGAAAARAAVLVVLSATLSVCLVRWAPGYGAGEEYLDARRDAARRVEADPVPTLVARTLIGYVRGDLGKSELLQRPVGSLIAERWRVTAAGVAGGLVLSWVLALGLSVAAVRYRRPWLDGSTQAGAGLLQCLPAALIGLGLLASGLRGPWMLAAGIALVLGPRAYRLTHAVLSQAWERECVQAARARGLGPWRLLLRHALVLAGAPLASLAGVSVAQSLGAAIPLEMVLDVPGLGQLAWQAALGRDLDLLVALTTLMGLAAIAANAGADALHRAEERP